MGKGIGHVYKQVKCNWKYPETNRDPVLKQKRTEGQNAITNEEIDK